jgi:two-component system sensor histidine kinase/response regulator
MLKLYSKILNTNFFKKASIYWTNLIGSSSVFSLETRIFHSISVCLIIMLCFYIPYNLYAGLYIASISALLISLFFFHQYYYSRFHNKRHNNTLFGLIGILIFGVNYFTNSGINGSTDLIWPVYLLLLFAISPYQQHFRWLIIFLLCFLLLHTVEYFYPHFVRHPFNEGKGQFIDRITVFPIPAIAIYIIIRFIRRSYDSERKAAHEKAIAIELSKEQIQLQKDQLEQSNNEKNKLMSIISHDLRAPLLSVQNYLELLNEEDFGSLERPVLEQALLKSTNNAMEMLSNLLLWSKSQMEGSYVQLMEVNLFAVLQRTLEMEKALAMRKNITLTYSIPPQMIVIADVNMLQLVVRNLISNAIKFTRHGGQVNINAEEILGECKITVSDDGGGMSPEIQKNIFSIKIDPAFGTNKEKGSGLGLILSKEFMERQGGRIGFESTTGHGSSFYIFIPQRI